MGNQNSLVAFMAAVTVALIDDVADIASTSKERDKLTLLSRLENEGVSFLTKTLPSLGKALDCALSGGIMNSTIGFSVRKDGGGQITHIPQFLGDLFERVINPADGTCRGDACVTSIQSLRQILYLWYKIELPHDESTNQKALSSLTNTWAESEEWLPQTQSCAILKKARNFISRLLAGFDALDIIPAHGPGSVSTGEDVAEKSHLHRIYKETELVYPFTEYMCFSLMHVCDMLSSTNSRLIRQTCRGFIDPDLVDADLRVDCEHLTYVDEPHSKVVLVPKDSRGPRVISSEPLELQFLQQGIGRKLMHYLEKHPWTKGQVNFIDQTVNRRLALTASLDRSRVTLDMKEASDRVSLNLVKTLFSGTPLLRSLLATRSVKSRLPDGRLIVVGAFAPMGSALCFPIEALVFYALAVSTISVHTGRPLTQVRKSVYVYGDDIIVYTQDYEYILQRFPEFGLMFNLGKCCTGGFFRESCGCDAYRGIDVTPVRVRTVWSDRRDPGVLSSYVSLSNSLYCRGYWRASNVVRERLEAVYGFLPRTSDWSVVPEMPNLVTVRTACPALVCTSQASSLMFNDLHLAKKRWNANLQRWEYKTWTSRPVPIKGDPDGWQTLFRRFTMGKSEDLPGVYTPARRVRLQRAWCHID